MVLAGLAGSCHMISATILALARLVYEFYGRCDIVNVCMGSLKCKRIIVSAACRNSSLQTPSYPAWQQFLVQPCMLKRLDCIPHITLMRREGGREWRERMSGKGRRKEGGGREGGEEERECVAF